MNRWRARCCVRRRVFDHNYAAGVAKKTRFPGLLGSLAQEEFQRDWSEGSPFHRQRLFRCGLAKGQPKGLKQLETVPPLDLDDVASSRDLVITNPYDDVRSLGKSWLRRNRWPRRWSTMAGIPFAYSRADLELLANQGKQLLEAAGVRETDTIGLLDFDLVDSRRWQLQAGIEGIGASVVRIDTVDQLASLPATVLIASPHAGEQILSAAVLQGVDVSLLHTVVSVGAPYGSDIDALLAICGDAVATVRLWAPDGVFGLWGQCRGGEGFHTWLHKEVVEVVDPSTGIALPSTSQRSGRIYWTGSGWRAMNVLRLDTNANAFAHYDPCENCGRSSMRLSPVPNSVTFEELMTVVIGTIEWCAEIVVARGRNRLDVYLAATASEEVASLVSLLEDEVGEVEVGLVSEDEIARRRAASGGEVLVDRRTGII